MAGKKEGAKIEDVSACKTKACLVSKGAEPIDTAKTPDGRLIETYKVLKAKGSTARAVMHGVLDVATLGLWEIAGTPIESSKGKKDYFALKVTYKRDNETIDKVELLQ